MKFLKKIKDFICKTLSAIRSLFSEEQKDVYVDERKGKRSVCSKYYYIPKLNYRPRQTDYG